MPGPVLYKTIHPLPSKIVYLRQTAEPTLVGYRDGRNLRFAPVDYPPAKVEINFLPLCRKFTSGWEKRYIN